MSAFPSLPLFTDAFIADTGHLGALETGAYLMLIMVAWRRPDCNLPDDDGDLAKWARVDRRTWARIKPRVMAFWTLGDGLWTQKRLLKEREIVSKRAEVSRENGRHGGRPKSLENKEQKNQAGNPQVSQTKAPIPNPNPIKKEPEAKASGERASAPRPRATRLPSDWLPSEDDIAYAIAKGLDPPSINREAEKFRNYWTAKSGKDATKVDWPATWRNWIINTVARESSQNGKRTHDPPRRASESTYLAGLARGLGFGESGLARPSDEEIPRGRFNIDA